MTYESLIQSGQLVPTVLGVLRGTNTTAEAMNFVLVFMDSNQVLAIAMANVPKVGTPHI